MPFNDYKKIKYLGKGGYGEVFKVKHVDTNEFFAMKIVSIFEGANNDMWWSWIFALKLVLNSWRFYSHNFCR